MYQCTWSFNPRPERQEPIRMDDTTTISSPRIVNISHSTGKLYIKSSLWSRLSLYKLPVSTASLKSVFSIHCYSNFRSKTGCHLVNNDWRQLCNWLSTVTCLHRCYVVMCLYSAIITAVSAIFIINFVQSYISNELKWTIS